MTINNKFYREGGHKRNGLLTVASQASRSLLRELLIILAFGLFTAILTWPYVTSLRDAVIDTGDPYFVAWTLWWDYHATFTDPLNLFHANNFYPLPYTLAFSEHCFGIAVLVFPLFALGLQPLTVHAIAIFAGFVLSGYGAFRLARTLTGSSEVAWVAGIAFAFVPYRLQLMSVLHYLFSAWLPLLFEALVLFARSRTRKRAAWFGFAFFMTGLTTISYLVLSLVPLALTTALLLTRFGLWRDRQIWLRGGAAVGLASLGLFPFMLPYVIVSRTYGFTRSLEEVKSNSAWPSHWLAAPALNKLWGPLGRRIPFGAHKLFPGLLSILLSLAALLPVASTKGQTDPTQGPSPRRRWLRTLDTIIVSGIFLLAAAFGLTEKTTGFFYYVSRDRLLALLLVAIIARVSIAYPKYLRPRGSTNLIHTLRSPRHSIAFWLGLLWTIVGFCYSLGGNFFLYRMLFDLVPLFKSMREPRRGAMFAYLGLAILAGLGAKRIAELVIRPTRQRMVYSCVCALLLFELNAAPLSFMHGEVSPDAVTLRMKQTSMRGGIVVLPAEYELNKRQILRAADHGKPLITGISSFMPPQENQIEQMTGSGPIGPEFLDLLEKIPASYVIVQTHLIAPEFRTVYETFFVRSVTSGRLRFIGRFDGRSDLYAVVKTEPQAQSQSVLPFGLPTRTWATMVEDDPINILGLYQKWSQKIFRLHIASFGRLPRYADFVRDVRDVGRGVSPGLTQEDDRLLRNFQEFVEAWTRRPEFSQVFDGLKSDEYVSHLCLNAGMDPLQETCAELASELSAGRETRTGVLLRIVDNPAFVAREDNRSLVLLHYFGYLHRNPDDAPDHNLDGMVYWIRDLERNGDRAKIARAFRISAERAQLQSEGNPPPTKIKTN